MTPLFRSRRRMPARPSPRLYALLFCLTLLLQSCTSSPPEQIPTIRIGHAPHDHHAPLYIAAMNPDYFKGHGGLYLKQISFRQEYQLMDADRPLANLVIDSTAGGERLVRTLDEGLNDLTFGGMPSFLNFIDRGSEMKILLPVMADGAGLVVRPDLPAQNWQEFITTARAGTQPLKIGVKSELAVQTLILEAALRAEGIASSLEAEAKEGDKIFLVNLSEDKNLLPALENGIIDGFVVNQPYVAMAEHKGAGKAIAQLSQLPPAGSWQHTPCCALAGSTSYVAAHPREVEALLTLLLRASQYISQHQEQSARQVAEWLDISPEIEQRSLPTITFTTEYTEDWERGVNFWIEAMITAGRLNAKVKTARDNNSLPNTIYDLEIYSRSRKKME